VTCGVVYVSNNDLIKTLLRDSDMLSHTYCGKLSACKVCCCLWKSVSALDPKNKEVNCETKFKRQNEEIMSSLNFNFIFNSVT